MTWVFILSAIMGGLLAIWLPILIYAIVASLLVTGAAIAGLVSGNGFIQVLIDCVFLSFCLALGCVFTHLVMYFAIVRARASSPKTSEIDVGSKYMSD